MSAPIAFKRNASGYYSAYADGWQVVIRRLDGVPGWAGWWVVECGHVFSDPLPSLRDAKRAAPAYLASAQDDMHQ